MRSLLVLALLTRTAAAGVEVAGDDWIGPFAKPEASVERGSHAVRLMRDLPDLDDGGPITEVVPLRVIEQPDGMDDSSGMWRIALRVTGSEWYVSPPLGRSVEGERYCGIEDLRRVGTRLAIRFRCLSGRVGWSEETSLLYCGVGRRHKIACGRTPLATRFAEDQRGTWPPAKDIVHDKLACKVGEFRGDAVTLLDDPPVVHGDEPKHVLTELAACPAGVVFHLDGERGAHVAPNVDLLH
jgi:hypothetical protein